MNEEQITKEALTETKPVLCDVLSYVVKEGNELYKIRNKRGVNYDFIMDKVIAFDTVEKHIRSQLKNAVKK